MNTFKLNSHTAKEGFWFSIGIGIVLYLASMFSETPRYISFLAGASLSVIPYLYLSFIERNEDVLDTWLAKSAITFWNMTFMSLLAYGDLVWLNLS